MEFVNAKMGLKRIRIMSAKNAIHTNGSATSNVLKIQYQTIQKISVKTLITSKQIIYQLSGFVHWFY